MIEHLPIEEWRTLDCAHPAPTGFARPYWSLAVMRAFPNLVADPVRITGAGMKPLIVPLLRDRGGKIPWRIWYGSLSGTYTCFLHEDGSSASADEIVAAIEEFVTQCDGCDITPWPLASGMDALLLPAKAKALRRIAHETSVADLRGGIERAYSQITDTSRRMARQADRRGVVCSVERGSTAASEYYGILEEAAVRWGIGTPTIRRQLLEACVQLGGADVEVWFARSAEAPDPIAGCVVLYGSQEAFLWSLAMRSAYSRLRPNNALCVALLKAGADRGVDWLNLGSSEGLPGVARFKRDLGARNNTYVTVRYERAQLTAWNRLRAMWNPSEIRDDAITG
jgi:hypothetical protein